MRAVQFVGRRDQLEALEQHLIHVMSGQPRVMLLEGVAGIGKTRFLDQLQHMAFELGFEVCSGRCDEMLTQPYAPFTPLLPRLEMAQTLDDADRAVLGEFLLWDRSEFTPYLGATEQAEADKLRLMMTVTRAATVLALRAPMLMVVDDLHLADQSSLDLFAYLAFSLVEQRTISLLLVGSYRPVTSTSHLGDLLGRLRHEAIT